MATAIRSFRLVAKRQQPRAAIQTHTPRSTGRRRWLSTTIKQWASDGKTTDGVDAEVEGKSPDINPSIPQQSQPNSVERSRELDDTLREIVQHHGRSQRHLPEELKNALPFREPPPTRQKPGLLNMGELPSSDPPEDPEFEEDDISSLAHGELEQHREFRHYARLAAWEMPLLTKMAKPFVPPNSKEILRFRYTTYMGEEHPAEKKVVVEFCPADIPDLTAVQQSKLKKLAGSRYNPETEIIKMSCEMFENQAQNKSYLGDLVNTLLVEARDPTDTFEDIPLDTRHHPIKAKPKFPVEWRMTEDRKAQLEAARQQSELSDQRKAGQGAIVDGVKKIQAALVQSIIPADAEMESQMAMARKGPAKKLKLRQH